MSPGTSRGLGGPRISPPGFLLEDYAHCLAALIEGLGFGPAHVVGLSWGGTLILELYRRHQKTVATLILADTDAGWKGSLSADEVRARVEGAREMLATPATAFDTAFPGLFAGAPPAQYAPLLSDIAADVRRDTLRIQLGLMAESDLRDVLTTIDVPTLLIWGEQDARSPLTVAREFATAIPGYLRDAIVHLGQAVVRREGCPYASSASSAAAVSEMKRMDGNSVDGQGGDAGSANRSRRITQISRVTRAGRCPPRFVRATSG